MATLPKPPYQNKVTDSQGYMDKGWLAYFTGMANSLISGWVSSITGVVNRIRVTGTAAAPVIDIDPAYDGNFIRKVPDSANSNTIQPTNPAYTPFILKGAPSQIGDMIRVLDAAGNALAYIDASGNIYAGANLIFTRADPVIRANTADESDTNRLMLSGGGDVGLNRGAYIQLLGNEFSETPNNSGSAVIAAGSGITGDPDPSGGKIYLIPGNGSVGVTINRDGSAVFGADVYVSGVAYLVNMAGSLNLNGSLTLSSFLTASGPFSASAGLFRSSNLGVNGAATDRGYGIFGTSGSFQIQIDSDEIQAMSNATPATLNLNQRGGQVTIGKDGTTALFIRSLTTHGAGLSFGYRAYTTNTTLDNSNCVVEGDATGGSFTFTLPSASFTNAGLFYTIFKTDSTANTVTVAASGDTIDGASSIVLGGNAGNSRLTIFSDGASKWRIAELYEEGTYPAALTGCTTVPTVTVAYVKNGKQVNLKIPVLTGTSNTTACTITGMPAHLIPAIATDVAVSRILDNSLDHLGYVTVNIDGTLDFTFFSAITTKTGTYTNAGTKGLGRSCLFYSIS